MTAAAAVITVLNEQIKKMEATVESLFHRHPDAGTYLSQPGIGVITGARMLGEFGDAPGRYADVKARRNYAGTSPLTIASGKKNTVHARFIHNDHLVNAMHDQAFAAISASPGARACYDELRARTERSSVRAGVQHITGTGLVAGYLAHHRRYRPAGRGQQPRSQAVPAQPGGHALQHRSVGIDPRPARNPD